MKRLVAWGGMGVVFEAHDQALQRQVALKVVRGEYADNEEAVARFLNEARAAATLKSEHVARVLDMGRLSDGVPFMVLEFLKGSDLAQLVREKGRLPTTQAVDYLLQACEALAEAHRAGVIHRDLKPENLFVSRGPDGSPVVKVLDFGISKRLKGNRDRSITNPASSIGSPMYMSPEQMKSPSDVDARSDIWSMGAVLFELLVGHSPFEADSMPEVCARVLSAPAPSLHDFDREIPDELDAIVQRCLDKEPSGRFENVAQLASALEPFGVLQTSLTVRRIALIAGRPSLAPDMSRRVSTASEGVARSWIGNRPSSAELRRFGKRYGGVFAAAVSAAILLVGSHHPVSAAGPIGPAAAGARAAHGSIRASAPLAHALEFTRFSPSTVYPVRIADADLNPPAPRAGLAGPSHDLGSQLDRAMHKTNKALLSSPDRYPVAAPPHPPDDESPALDTTPDDVAPGGF